jgi:uncharacterized protein with PQ loop repeat
MIIATSTFTASLAVAAPVITIFQALAQGARIRSTGARGVSLGTWLLSAFVAEIWLCYGFVFHVPAEIFANVPCLIVASVVAFLAAKSRDKLFQSVMKLRRTRGHHGGGGIHWHVPTTSLDPGSSCRVQFGHHLSPPVGPRDPPQGRQWRFSDQLVYRVHHRALLARLRISHPSTAHGDAELCDVARSNCDSRASDAPPN